jgi:small subunit ribosomal protein S19e
MASVFDVNGSALVHIAAEKLKGVIKEPPAYIFYVKSGANKERPPLQKDFWYLRSASILRQVYINGPVGTSRLRTRYGGRKQHVVHKQHAKRAGGSVIMDAFSALEAASLIKSTKEGRIITPKGKAFLDKISNEIKGK